jgi:hypothetical protein
MDTERFLVEIEQEIARLQQVASALRGLSGKRRGRKMSTSTSDPKPKRRKMSAAARKRIGDAQRKRWAKARRG